MRPFAPFLPVLVGLAIGLPAGCAALVCIEGEDCEGGSGGSAGPGSTSSQSTGTGGDATTTSSVGGAGPSATTGGGGGGGGQGGGGACQTDCSGLACEGTHCATQAFSTSKLGQVSADLRSLAVDGGQVYVGFQFNGTAFVASVDEPLAPASSGSLATTGNAPDMGGDLAARDGVLAYASPDGGVHQFVLGDGWTQELNSDFVASEFDGTGQLWGLSVGGYITDTQGKSFSPNVGDAGLAFTIDRGAGRADWSVGRSGNLDCVAFADLTSPDEGVLCVYNLDAPGDIVRVGSEVYVRISSSGVRRIWSTATGQNVATTTMPSTTPGFVAADADWVYFDDQAEEGETLVRRCPHVRDATDDGCETLDALADPLRGLEVSDDAIYFLTSSTLHVIRK